MSKPWLEKHFQDISLEEDIKIGIQIDKKRTHLKDGTLPHNFTEKKGSPSFAFPGKFSTEE